MRDARGTSPSGGDDDRTPAPRRRLALFGVVAVLAYGLDQVTKWLAVEHLTGRDDIELVGELLQLRLIRNPGAAWGLGSDYTWIFTCLAIAAVGVVIAVLPRVRSRVWAWALGLLAAGVVGNLTDRVFREPSTFHGHVVDFLMLPNWPIFNVADMSLNAAVVLILLQTLRGIGLDGEKIDDHEPAPDTPDTPAESAPSTGAGATGSVDDAGRGSEQ